MHMLAPPHAAVQTQQWQAYRGERLLEEALHIRLAGSGRS